MSGSASSSWSAAQARLSVRSRLYRACRGKSLQPFAGLGLPSLAGWPDDAAAVAASPHVSQRRYAFAAPQKAITPSTRLAIAFQPASDRPRMRSAALSQDGGRRDRCSSSTPAAARCRRCDDHAAIGRAGPPAPFDAGVVDAEIEAVGHQQPPSSSRPRVTSAGSRASDARNAQRHQRRADIVGHALLVAELARDVAADVLEAERRADDRRHGDSEEERGAAYEHAAVERKRDWSCGISVKPTVIASDAVRTRI